MRAGPRLLASGGDVAQVPDEQQVLEVGGDRGQVLKRLDRLFSAVGVAGAQSGGEDALQELGLTVSRAAEDAQVAPADAVARQLGHGAHDLPLGFVEVPGSPAQIALDHAKIDELTDQLGVGARLLAHVLERIQSAGVASLDERAAERSPVAGSGD